MILGIPLGGPQPDDIPSWVPLEDGLSAGTVKISGKIPKKDWRSQVAAQPSWIAWFEIDKDERLGIGIGLIAHAADEKDVRKSGFVSVRPFTRQRTEVPLSTIIGALELPEAERGIWAQLDWKAASSVAPHLAHTRFFIIREHPQTGAPCCVFSPARWMLSARSASVPG